MSTTVTIDSDDFDRILLESVICDGGDPYIVEKLIELFNERESQELQS
jgi:hypothetical protein